jgi:exonuclease VII large subunit
MKADIKSETENFIQRLERENQKLNKQFTEKLNSENRSVSHKVSQVQKEVEVGLRASKKNIDTVKENLDGKLNQQTSQTNTAIDELASRIVGART